MQKCNFRNTKQFKPFGSLNFTLSLILHIKQNFSLDVIFFFFFKKSVLSLKKYLTHQQSAVCPCVLRQAVLPKASFEKLPNENRKSPQKVTFYLTKLYSV